MNAPTDSFAHPAMAALLPPALLALPLPRLALAPATLALLAERQILTVGDALAHAGDADTFGDGRDRELAEALARGLHDSLQHLSADEHDWATLRARLLGALAAAQRPWLEQLVGFDAELPTMPALARSLGITTAALEERAEQLRSALATQAAGVLSRLHREAAADLAAYDGVLTVEHAAAGSLVAALAKTAPDRSLGLRLLAFLFPRECHYHRSTLFALSPRRFRRLLRTLPSLLPQHRLPLPLDTLLDELRALDHRVPRGMLQHLLRTELRIAIELDAERGEVAAPDARSPAARMAELLQEAGQPMSSADLTFAYRERFRRGSQATVLRHLRRRREFVMIANDLWALRADHAKELAAVAPLVDRIARRLCSDGGRHHVADLLPEDERDDRTLHYVLDRLAHDPRVRLLGRGDACAATHRRSRVLETLLTAFRKAGGDVVLHKFLDNQPPEQRRLVERLLLRNRLFVQPADDRIDLLSNWPFNEERMGRLLALVQDHLRSRAGYAHADALKTKLDATDLGGNWLTVPLLLDVLRRNGPFEILPGDLVAHLETGLTATVRRTVRQALRDAGTPLSLEDVLKAKPELCEFATCLRELLDDDPLVQTADGIRFQLT